MDRIDPEVAHLLYDDDEGNIIGLDEVQLLDPPPAWRVPHLRRLLQTDDPFLAYQAALVLAAWGDDQGLEAVERMIDSRVDRVAELSPHRIHGQDNVYDEVAYAVHLSGLSGREEPERARIFRKLLSLYGERFFESKLKYALLKSSNEGLAPDVEQAIGRALKLRRDYLASQLLPVLSRWRPDRAWELIATFLEMPPQTPNPVCNVAEALGYIGGQESRKMLERLTQHPDPTVADEARQSLSLLSANG